MIGQYIGADTLKEMESQLQGLVNRQRFRDQLYNATDFSANAGVWTVGSGNLQLFCYAVQQDVMHIQGTILNSSTDANIGANLYVRIPGGYRSRGYYQVGTMFQFSPALREVGIINTTSSPDNRLVLSRPGAGVFPASRVNDLGLFFAISFRVYKP